MRSRRPWVIFLIGLLLAAAAVSQTADGPGAVDGSAARP